MYLKIALFILMSTVVFCDIYKIETKNFVIAYEEKMKSEATLLSHEIEEIAQLEFEFYDYYPEEKITVGILDNVDYENAFANISSTIILYPNTPPDNIIAKNYENWITFVFAHELTHIIIANSYDGFVKRIWGVDKYIHNLLTPNWLHEGLAVYSETKFTSGGRGKAHNFHMKLKEIVNSDDFIGLELAGTYNFNGEYAYTLGYSFIEFFAEEYGEEKLKEAVKYFMKNQHKTALYSFCHAGSITPDILEDNWTNWVKLKYSQKKNIVEGIVIDEISGGKKSLRVEGNNLYFYDIFEKKFLKKSRQYGVYKLDINDIANKEKVITGNIVNGFDVLNEKVYYSLLLPDFLKNEFYAISFKEEKKLFSGVKHLDIRRAVDFVNIDNEIAYVYRDRGKQALKYIDGEVIIDTTKNYNFEKLYFYENAIYFSASKKGEKGTFIYSYDMESKEITKIIDGSFPFVNEEGIYFVGRDINGTDNVFLLRNIQEKALKLTDVRYGSAEPVVVDGDLYFFNYDDEGYTLNKLNRDEFLNATDEKYVSPNEEDNKIVVAEESNNEKEELFVNDLKYDYGVFTGASLTLNYADTFKRQELMIGMGYDYSYAKEETQPMAFANYRLNSMNIPIANLYGEFTDKTYGELSLNIPLFVESKTAYYFLNGSVNSKKEYSYGLSFANILGYIRYDREDYTEEMNMAYFDTGAIGVKYYWSQEENEINQYIFPSEVLVLDELEIEDFKLELNTKKAWVIDFDLKYERIIERGTRDGFIVLKNINLKNSNDYIRWKSGNDYLDIGFHRISLGTELKLVYHMDMSFDIGVINAFDYDEKSWGEASTFAGFFLYF